VVINPVGAGIVASAERPGGNMTGVESSLGEGVKLEWLTKIVPHVKRVYVPYNPDDTSGKLALAQLEQVAPKLGVELVVVETRSADQVTEAIANIPADVDALFMVTDSLNAGRRSDWAKAALARKLPLAVPPGGEPTEEGALFTFGFSPAAVGGQAARLADQILKGAAPADLPIETPELFLSINLKTAQTIGLEISDDILRQAATVIR
ncbi:MAG: ABC transporter substrate-binding protein, partial [Anaerolineae bacterium]|nr:ABC transporter substrate-binding protein [Anaerolineae bacterium]